MAFTLERMRILWTFLSRKLCTSVLRLDCRGARADRGDQSMAVAIKLQEMMAAWPKVGSQGRERRGHFGDGLDIISEREESKVS